MLADIVLAMTRRVAGHPCGSRSRWSAPLASRGRRPAGALAGDAAPAG